MKLAMLVRVVNGQKKPREQNQLKGLEALTLSHHIKLHNEQEYDAHG